MRIENDATLKLFRLPGRCEVCGVACPEGRDPDHVRARGMGDAWRLDIPENIVSSCRQCHLRRHSGTIPVKQLWEIVEARCGLPDRTAKDIAHFLVRQDEGASAETLEAAVEEAFEGPLVGVVLAILKREGKL